MVLTNKNFYSSVHLPNNSKNSHIISSELSMLKPGTIVKPEKITSMIPPSSSNINKGQSTQGQGPKQTQQNTTVPPAPPTPPVKPQKKKGAWLPLSIGLGVLMLLAVAWLTYTSINTTRELEQKIAELEEAERLQSELESQYFDALTELDNLKGENADINNMIEQQKVELEEQKQQIDRLLRDKRKLDVARSEIADLKNRIATYVAEIEQLTLEQEQLRQNNELLQSENTELATNLEAQSNENQQLKEYQTKLVSEKEDLARSVRLGSVIKVKEISVTGLKVGKNGKTAERRSAKRVDRLNVCFTTMENEIVEPGTETFYIRIINPKGETLAIDDLGAGVLQNTATGEEVRFSQAQEYEYANEETQLCFNWEPGLPLQSGKYDVEIYNKGYLAGKSTFELK